VPDSRQLTESELLDLDVAIQILTAPIWIAYFAALIVAGTWNDWRARG
jgi:hypothetical protein